LSDAHGLSRRTVLQVLRAAPFVVLALIMLVLVLRGSHTASIPTLHAPKDAPAVAPITSSTIDRTKVVLPPVGGTTTTAPAVQTGGARIRGTVSTAQGPVPGATVRVERIVKGGHFTHVVTDADGRWQLRGLAGGRYRVRAFLPPRLAQPEAQVFFLADGETYDLDLSMQAYEGLTTASAIAPDPPLQNQPFTLAMRVAARSVDGDGQVLAQPLPGAVLTLTIPGTAQLQGPGALTTDASGAASFTLICRAPSPTQVTVSVRATAADPAQTLVVVDVAACPPPAAPSSSSP
jgi:hypothetical protein